MDVAVSLMLQDLCVIEVEHEVASCKAIFVSALCWFPTPPTPLLFQVSLSVFSMKWGEGIPCRCLNVHRSQQVGHVRGRQGERQGLYHMVVIAALEAIKMHGRACIAW